MATERPWPNDFPEDLKAILRRLDAEKRAPQTEDEWQAVEDYLRGKIIEELREEQKRRGPAGL